MNENLIVNLLYQLHTNRALPGQTSNMQALQIFIGAQDSCTAADAGLTLSSTTEPETWNHGKWNLGQWN